MLTIYQRRLSSNLRAALRPISTDPAADAETLGALIDGLYLRAALGADMSAQDALGHALNVAHKLIEGRA